MSAKVAKRFDHVCVFPYPPSTQPPTHPPSTSGLHATCNLVFGNLLIGSARRNLQQQCKLHVCKLQICNLGQARKLHIEVSPWAIRESKFQVAALLPSTVKSPSVRLPHSEVQLAPDSATCTETCKLHSEVQLVPKIQVALANATSTNNPSCTFTCNLHQKSKLH